jgi:hypothetical protein
MLDLKQVIPQPIVEFCCGRGFLLWPRIFAAVSRGIYENTPRNFSFFAAENSGPYSCGLMLSLTSDSEQDLSSSSDKI